MKENDDLCHIYDVNLFNVNDFDVLLHETLKQARTVLSSEAGSIYINEGESLAFNVFQNDAMSYENIYRQFYALKDVKLPLGEHEKYLAVKSYVSNKVIIIDDVYEAHEYDFLGVKEFDKRFDYRTKSIISIPIVHPIEDKKLGVLQLLNKSEDGELVCYNEKDKQMISMISSFIGLSIYKAQEDIGKLKRLNQKLEEANAQLKERVAKEVAESERKSAIIFHQSKLASLGEMIGNIAHQWRQPLSAISTIASGISFNMELDGYDEKEVKRGFDQIVKTTKHLSQTIDDFRNFYKIDKHEKEFNLSNNILQSISITEASLSENYIQIITNLDKNITLYGYDNEMKQALLNIIQNAKDAFLENTDKDSQRLLFIDLIKDETSIKIKIRDNAFGIPESIIDKIFEQDFTTKLSSGGTGIGLYMTKEIITRHMHGTIDVSNVEYLYNDKKQKGAQFTFSFNLDNNKSL